MEQIHSNITLSRLFFFLRILLCNIRVKCFLSIFIFSFQTIWKLVSQSFRTSPKSYPSSSSEPVKSLNRIQSGLRLGKEEVIVVMEKLGISVERDGEGIGDFSEEEITKMFENGASMAEMEEAFDVFDENKDGFIDATELQRVLRCLGMEKDFVQCQKMINGVDQNGDELIDHNEFLKLMEQSFELNAL